MSIAEKVHGYELSEVEEFIEEQRGKESGRWEMHEHWQGTHVQKVTNRMLQIRKTSG